MAVKSHTESSEQLPASPGAIGAKARALVYWTATILIALETLVGGGADLAHRGTMLVAGPAVVGIISHLGYPVYFLRILGIWKVLGAITVLAPGLARLKEWAYAGIFFELTGAAASYVAHGDPPPELISPLILAALAIASWALRPPDRMLGVLLPRVEGRTSHPVLRDRRVG